MLAGERRRGAHGCGVRPPTAALADTRLHVPAPLLPSAGCADAGPRPWSRLGQRGEDDVCVPLHFSRVLRGGVCQGRGQQRPIFAPICLLALPSLCQGGLDACTAEKCARWSLVLRAVRAADPTCELFSLTVGVRLRNGADRLKRARWTRSADGSSARAFASFTRRNKMPN